MTEYRLTSTGFIYTPGIINWAKACGETNFWPTVKMIQEAYKLPERVAVDLVSGKQHYRVEDEDVVFQTEDYDD